MMAAALQIIWHGKTISVSRFLVLTLPAVDPVFCANRRNYLREKIAKNAIFALLPFVRTSFCLSAPFSFYPPGSRSLRANANTRVMIRHFAGISARPVTHRLLVQILRAPDIKVTVMTSAKNVDDTKIRIPSTDPSRSSALSLKSPLFLVPLNCMIVTYP